jgi:ABC-type multidrug transport system ATPase subunit
VRSASDHQATNGVVVDGITKTFRKGALTAVNDVSFTVRPGELFGLIGPDGAGKTTIFRILATLMLADRGTATVAGYDVVTDFTTIRTMVGYMPGRFSLYQDLTVEENLKFFATLFETTVEEQYDLIRDIYVQLEPFKDRRAAKLSGGMKQKLALCCALVHEPQVLLLDEPTTGVDPVSRHEFWIMLKRLKERGITILVSTPYMDEALQCDRIALIDQGALMSVDTPAAVIAAFDAPLYVARASNILALRRQLAAHPLVERVYTFSGDLHLTFVDEPLSSAARVIQDVRSAGITDAELDPTIASIEDCFIRLMSA